MAAVTVAIAFSGGRRAEAVEELRKSGERDSDQAAFPNLTEPSRPPSVGVGFEAD